MHSGQTADPLNPFSKAMKAISSKRSKTESDYEEMAKVEWFASLYVNKEGFVILPGHVLEATFHAGSRKAKLGKQAQAGMFVYDHAPLEFDGCELDKNALFERDQNRHCAAVRIGQSKVMRTRSIFEDWSADVEITYNDTMLNKSQVIQSVLDAGEQVGICDWRPKFGRFHAEFAN